MFIHKSSAGILRMLSIANWSVIICVSFVSNCYHITIEMANRQLTLLCHSGWD